MSTVKLSDVAFFLLISASIVGMVGVVAYEYAIHRIECVPAATRCKASVVELCGGDDHWHEIIDCASAANPRAGCAVVDGFAACRGGDAP